MEGWPAAPASKGRWLAGPASGASAGWWSSARLGSGASGAAGGNRIDGGVARGPGGPRRLPRRRAAARPGTLRGAGCRGSEGRVRARPGPAAPASKHCGSPTRERFEFGLARLCGTGSGASARPAAPASKDGWQPDRADGLAEAAAAPRDRFGSVPALAAPASKDGCCRTRRTGRVRVAAAPRDGAGTTAPGGHCIEGLGGWRTSERGGVRVGVARCDSGSGASPRPEATASKDWGLPGARRACNEARVAGGPTSESDAVAAAPRDGVGTAAPGGHCIEGRVEAGLGERVGCGLPRLHETGSGASPPRRRLHRRTGGTRPRRTGRVRVAAAPRDGAGDGRARPLHRRTGGTRPRRTGRVQVAAAPQNGFGSVPAQAAPASKDGWKRGSANGPVEDAAAPRDEAGTAAHGHYIDGRVAPGPGARVGCGLPRLRGTGLRTPHSTRGRDRASSARLR